VDENGDVNPYREDPDKIDNNFQWSEVFTLIFGHEVLMLAFF